MPGQIPPYCKQAAGSGRPSGMSMAYFGWWMVSSADDTVYSVLAAFTALSSDGECLAQTMQIGNRLFVGA